MEEYEIPKQQGLGDKLDKLVSIMEKSEGVKKEKGPKPFSMPWKGRLNNSKLMQGYATVIEIAENSAISFRKERITDATVKLDDTYHAVGDASWLTYKGKPVLIIAKKDKNPYNPNSVDNETFGQKHIMSRMMNEVLGIKKKMGMMGMSIGALILVGVALYAFIAG